MRRSLLCSATPRRFAASIAVACLCALAALTALTARYGLDELRARALARLFHTPTVGWPTQAPSRAGLDGAALDRLWQSLLTHGTHALLVARSGSLVYERYAADHGPNERHATSALAKALTGIPALLVCLQDQRIGLDDPLVAHAPKLGAGEPRSHIRIRDLAFHTAGLDDVDFYQGEKGALEGWRKEYFEHPERRFDYALRMVPVLAEPGTRMSYSGVGYYALAYAVTQSLHGSRDADIRSLLRNRVMKPLGIPDTAWSLSYETSYEEDGMRLYAFGSGGAMTARAAARIGEWLLGRGTWQSRALVDAERVDSVLGRDRAETHPLLSVNHGWFVNVDDSFHALPRDAFFGYGGSHQVVVVVPSLQLVAVRFGESLDPTGDAAGTDVLERELFAPLLAAVRPEPDAAAGPR